MIENRSLKNHPIWFYNEIVIPLPHSSSQFWEQAVLGNQKKLAYSISFFKFIKQIIRIKVIKSEMLYLLFMDEL